MKRSEWNQDTFVFELTEVEGRFKVTKEESKTILRFEQQGEF